MQHANMVTRLHRASNISAATLAGCPTSDPSQLLSGLGSEGFHGGRAESWKPHCHVLTSPWSVYHLVSRSSLQGAADNILFLCT